jgi:hypothetical protein
LMKTRKRKNVVLEFRCCYLPPKTKLLVCKFIFYLLRLTVLTQSITFKKGFCFDCPISKLKLNTKWKIFVLKK